MKVFAVFAFFMAMFAMLCNSVSAQEMVALERRAPKAGFDASVDLVLKAHADIVAKVFAEVCQDADVSAAIKTNLRLQVSGFVNIDFGIGSRLSAAVQESIKAAVKAEVDADIKAEFTKNLRANVHAIIIKRCPKKDNVCIRAQAKNIVKDAANLTVKASAKISASIQAKLAARIKTALDIQLKKFQFNLIVVKVNITGDVAVSKSIGFKFKVAASAVAKACATISAKLIAQIRAVCA
ncbi:hypothetical protein DFQ27_004316 [Actinomortierella ambigua]|uniref:Uncharacterized protein n=1 Tax=Actinomortierella ambigua TaxID=1343610 RepID=A0A9P6UCG5_9FUNG|nr:hypothetical protein DFQ27_004316 [Actinomortierella ambigua]